MTPLSPIRACASGSPMNPQLEYATANWNSRRRISSLRRNTNRLSRILSPCPKRATRNAVPTSFIPTSLESIRNEEIIRHGPTTYSSTFVIWDAPREVTIRVREQT